MAGRVLSAVGSRAYAVARKRGRILVGCAFAALTLVGCLLVARHLTRTSWPLQRAHMGLVVLAGGPGNSFCQPSARRMKLAGASRPGALSRGLRGGRRERRRAAPIQTERAQITKARGFVGGREVRSGSGVQPRRGCRDPAHACARSRRRRRDTGRYSGPACSAQGHALRTPTRGGRTFSEPQKPALVRDSSQLLADGGVSGSSVHVRARETAAACSLGAPSPR